MAAEQEKTPERETWTPRRTGERRAFVSRLRIDPSMNLGDVIVLCTTLILLGAAYARQDTRLDGHDIELRRLDTVDQALAADARASDIQSQARSEQLRQEMKADLGEINDKLDRLIERELDGHHTDARE